MNLKIRETLQAGLDTSLCHKGNNLFFVCSTSTLEISGLANCKRGNCKYQYCSNTPCMINLSRQKKWSAQGTRTISTHRNLEILQRNIEFVKDFRKYLSLFMKYIFFIGYVKVSAIAMVRKVVFLPLGWLIQNHSHLQKNQNTINVVVTKN